MGQVGSPNKMVDLNPNILIIALYINGLKTPIKRLRLLEKIG